MKRLFPMLLLCIAFPLYAQEADDGDATGEPSAGDGETATEETLLPESETDRLEPVFPETSTALIPIEAEDAVSTNFAKEPTLNYAASGFRTLQLNRYTALAGGDAFFAEFVFYADEPGTYQLWYGGTPPGPREDVFPSYASPFSYRLDGGDQVRVYREDVSVIEGYNPAYYWVRVTEVDVEAGMHTVRFEISEKRRFDGKFFFYLDSLFLVDRGRFDQEHDPTPPVFPADLDRNDLDAPFRSISDYEYFISQEPDNVDVYIELSLIYSLIGDYVNALKNLGRAALIDPENTEVQLLAAKNRIWKGDAAEGLRVYRRLLEIDPDNVDVWAEAGKVAAWIGKYRESIQFYRSGLREAPDNLNLMVNLGITYLWDNQPDQAEIMFDRATDVAFEQVPTVSRLGDIYMVNGYPDRAISSFRSGIREFPRFLELYLKLEDAYSEIGRVEDAERIHEQIADRFVPSDRLTSYLDSFRIKQTMKEEVIASYQKQLEQEPDNLDLRELLVQTYFWNGLRRRAIDEYLSILANYAYRTFREFDERNSDLFQTLDSLHVHDDFYAAAAAAARSAADGIVEALDVYRSAVRTHERYLERVKKAQEKGEEPPTVEGVPPGEARVAAESDLARRARDAERLLTWYESATEVLDEPDTLVDPYLEQEQRDREAFAQVTASVGWEWNRRATISELEEVSRAGVVLADHVLSRVYLAEGDPETAERYARQALSPTYLALPTVYALGQALFWQDKHSGGLPYTPESAYVEYAPYIASTNISAVGLEVPTGSRSGLFTEETPERAEELVGGLRDLADSVTGPRESLARSIDVLETVLEHRMRRIWYQIDQDTYLLRFELGDYYLLEEEYRKAIAEFNKVLAIDPWNTSATYKLGTLHQLAGEWRQAMDKYRQVYFADPRFENVAGNYNNLARLHADSLSFENYASVDTSRLGYHARAAFTNNISGFLGIDLEATTDTVRRFQSYGGVSPSTYQYHTVHAKTPISLSRLGTTITLIGGVSFVPSLVTGSVNLPSEAENPLEVLGTYSIEPALGAEIGVNAGPVYVGGTYRYRRVPETLYPEKPRVMTHTGELNAVLSFGFLDVPLLQYSSARTYGKLDLRIHEDGSSNPIIAAAQELTQVFHLRDTPWTNLTVAGQAVFERAWDPIVDAYYSPNDVFLLKGGVGVGSWLGIGDGNVLGLSARADIGLHAVDVFGRGEALGISTTGDTKPDLSLEANLRVEYTKGDSTYYAALQGSATVAPAASAIEYWSGLLRLGYSADLPRLLAD